MNKSAKSGRPSKRDVIVINDDESTNEQPAEKSAKIEEEVVPPAQVVELQQEVLKLKDMFQRACRAARTAELRAEAAETRLDSKYGIKEAFEYENARADDLEKRLAEVSTLLDEAISRADNIFNENAELARENKELKMELIEMRRSTGAKHGDSVNSDQQKSVNYMKSELAEERVRAREDRERYRTKIDELKEKLAHNENLMKEEQRESREDRARFREREECLTDQLEEEKRLAREDRSRYRARIDELTAKIDHLEQIRTSDDRVRYQERIVELEQKLARREERIEEEKRAAKEDRARYRTRIDELTHKLDQYKKTELVDNERGNRENYESMNIFETCRQELTDLISYERAREKLLSVITKLEGRTLENKLNQGFAKSPKLDTLILHCATCEKTLNKIAIIQHFISNKHGSKVRAKGIAVSRGAIEYWVSKLKPDAQSMQQLQPPATTRVAARPIQLPAVAATAACPEVSEESKEIEKEEGEIDD